MKKTGVISVQDSPNEAKLEQNNPPHRILVVDDDDDVRQLSVDVLIDFGYEVGVAKDGADGWEALQADSYDLIVTDNKMPRMTGIEMLEKLRSARMELPVIMATGSLPTYEFVRKPWLTPDSVLQRPFTPEELLDTVQKVLSKDDGYSTESSPLLRKYL